MTSTEIRVERKIGQEVYSIETGFIAKQAGGSCIVRYGDTTVFAAAVTGGGRPGIDFFPLTVDYRERVAAAGKFPGGFIKREGRPTTRETLTSRLIDRPCRPLFPDWLRDEVQVQAMVLSSDRQNDPDVLAVTATSVALCLSPAPFKGPLAAVRLGLVDGEYIVFPTQDQLVDSELDLVVAGTADEISMIEGFACELPEDKMAEAIVLAHTYIKEIVSLQNELLSQINVVKKPYAEPAPSRVLPVLVERYLEAFKAAKRTEGKIARNQACAELKARAVAELIPDPAAEGAYTPAEIGAAWGDLELRGVRELILTGVRPDGRGYKQLRPLLSKVDFLPRVHGSAVFQRGETQAVITVTLGTGRDEQKVDGLFEEYSKRFMLDYYFPPFSVGEVKPIRGPGRREIGHGALAERSVKPVLPEPEKFPYSIRVISDIMESNGSSSMASVCGATLGLMAAGVPLNNPVAGISIGLVKQDDGKFVLLTDIQGDEDHYGDMDFKVAGSQRGVTGIQLDLKVTGISEQIVRETLVQAREARIEILRSMLSAISRPRADISKYAPRLERTHIDPEKIGLLIGPGGKTIRAIQEQTQTVIEVSDDGTVLIAGDSLEASKAALRRVEALTETVQVGKIYEGKVTSIKDFGAFVEILPGKDGLCHISELADGYVKSVTDVCKVGDEIRVKVIAIDEQDRVKLSRKAVQREESGAAPAAAAPAPAPSGRQR